MPYHAKTERNAEVVRSAASGEPQANIAARLNISRQRVNQILKRNSRLVMTADRRETRIRNVRSDFIMGIPIREICERYKIARQTIERYVSEEDIEMRQTKFQSNKDCVMCDIINGMKPSDVTDKYGIPYGTIHRIMGDEYYANKKEEMRKRNQCIIEFHNSGKRNCDIAKELNIPIHIVHNVIYNT